MLKEIFAEYAKTLEVEWDYDRTQTVGASEIGQCARKTFWLKNEGTERGVERDADHEENWGARIRGTLMERHFWAPAMQLRFGDNILFSGHAQKTLFSGYLSATPDALIIKQKPDVLKYLGIDNIGEGVLLAEGKTIDPRTNISEAKIENYMQTVAQMGLVRECTEYKPNYDLLTYTDASFWSEITEFAIPFDQKLYDEAKRRAAIIIHAKNGNELRPEGWIAGGKECSFCPFVGACGVERMAVPPNNVRATPQFIAEITDYAREANAISVQIERLEAQFNDRQNVIKERLKDKGVRRIEGVVNWYRVSGRPYYAIGPMKEQLTALGIDIEQFEHISKDSDRLVITATLPAEAYKPALMEPGNKKRRKKQKAKTVKTKAKIHGRKPAVTKRAKTAKRKGKRS